MKTRFITILLIALILICSCNNEPKKPDAVPFTPSAPINPVNPTVPDDQDNNQNNNENTPSTEYKVGDRGPLGWIIYDVDADNTEEDPDGKDNLKSDICGWRYMEAAPGDIEIELENGTKLDKFIFGLYREDKEGDDLLVGTSTDFGAGLSNSLALFQEMGDEAYECISNSTSTNADNGKRTPLYAALLCLNYKVNEVGEGWFLPSREEILKMKNLYNEGKGNFARAGQYWTSSETMDDIEHISAYYMDFGWGYCSKDGSREWHYRVRPVRVF